MLLLLAGVAVVLMRAFVTLLAAAAVLMRSAIRVGAALAAVVGLIGVLLLSLRTPAVVEEVPPASPSVTSVQARPVPEGTSPRRRTGIPSMGPFRTPER